VELEKFARHAFSGAWHVNPNNPNEHFSVDISLDAEECRKKEEKMNKVCL
jgi:hypothetical protein